MSGERVMASPYMHWAKTRQSAKYTLAVSGIGALPFCELGAAWEDLALNEAPGYGRQSLCEALAAQAGVDPSRIVLATGTSGANHLVLATLLAPSDEIVLERPGYEPIDMLARHLGATVRYVQRRSENGFRLDPADVAQAVTPATRIVVLTNLHNPSSVATDERTLREVGAIAERVGARVVVDEAYLEAAFEGAPPSAARLGDTFVATTSLTKVFGLSALRCGWIVATPDLAERIWQLKNLFGVNEVHPAGGLALCALRNRDAILARTRRVLEANRAVWDSFLAGRDDLAMSGTPVGTTVFPRVLTGDSDGLCARLRERYETSIVPGRFFGEPAHVRVGLSADPLIFPEGIARLGRALDELRG